MSATAMHPLPTPLVHYEPPAELVRWQRFGLVAAGVGAAACLVGVFVARDQFARSYLVAYLDCIAIALGCLGLSMLNHLTHGAWGVVVRRIFEAGASTLPALALLFVPIALNLQQLYSWARPEVVAADPILTAKAAYLNPGGMLLRAALFFAIWIALAVSLGRWSDAQDRADDPRLYHKMRAASAAGLILFMLTVSFATFDWLMSLDPHWFSSIYGLQFIGGAAIAAMTVAILVSTWLVRRPPMNAVYQPRHHHDHGTLLFAFLLLWGYFTVSQFLIIWSANLPEETPYFVHRFHASWKILSLILVLVHFWFPFLSLLSKKIKRVPRRLAFYAGLVLVMRWFDLYFQAAPNFRPEGVRFHWLDLATTLCVGGVFLYLFARRLRGRSLLPVHDPFLPEALAHE
jgi:hypothetical protein